MRVKPNPRGWPQDVKTAPLTSKEDLLRYGPGKIEVFPPGHSEHVAGAKKRGSAHSWAKYEKKLDPVAVGSFKKNHDAFLTAAKQIIDQRTDDLIQWLEAKALDDALEDWTERSAFGKNTKIRFGSPQSQKQGLEQALVEVGLAA